MLTEYIRAAMRHARYEILWRFPATIHGWRVITFFYDDDPAPSHVDRDNLSD